MNTPARAGLPSPWWPCRESPGSALPEPACSASLRFPPGSAAIAGQDLRGLGWDIDAYQSLQRGMVFPVGSFGHSGFTGVTLWIDPGSDSYVVVLANVIHQRGGPPGGPPIVKLSGDVATIAARALHLYGS